MSRSRNVTPLACVAVSTASKLLFLLLVAIQAAHSVEEYAGRLYEVFWPARFVSGLVSDNLSVGFIVINAAVIVLGVWCYFGPVRAGLGASWGVAWLWLTVELANGVGHISIAVWEGHYLPGTITAPALAVTAASLALSLRTDRRNLVNRRAPPNGRMPRTRDE